MDHIEKVEGIGPSFATKLAQLGITTTASLLDAGATAKGRKKIAEQSGISPSLVLRWVNHADLFRVKGIGPQYADLLEAAGVDTVAELAKRSPLVLYQKLTEANEEKQRVRQVPALSQVTRWVQEAAKLPRLVSH